MPSQFAFTVVSIFVRPSWLFRNNVYMFKIFVLHLFLLLFLSENCRFKKKTFFDSILATQMKAFCFKYCQGQRCQKELTKVLTCLVKTSSLIPFFSS